MTCQGPLINYKYDAEIYYSLVLFGSLVRRPTTGKQLFIGSIWVVGQATNNGEKLVAPAFPGFIFQTAYLQNQDIAASRIKSYHAVLCVCGI